MKRLVAIAVATLVGVSLAGAGFTVGVWQATSQPTPVTTTPAPPPVVPPPTPTPSWTPAPALRPLSQDDYDDAIDRLRRSLPQQPHEHPRDDYVGSREWYEDQEQERRLDQLEAEAQRRRLRERRWNDFPQQQEDCQKYGGMFCW